MQALCGLGTHTQLGLHEERISGGMVFALSWPWTQGTDMPIIEVILKIPRETTHEDLDFVPTCTDC